MIRKFHERKPMLDLDALDAAAAAALSEQKEKPPEPTPSTQATAPQKPSTRPPVRGAAGKSKAQMRR
jgi:hypothetical protein